MYINSEIINEVPESKNNNCSKSSISFGANKYVLNNKDSSTKDKILNSIVKMDIGSSEKDSDNNILDIIKEDKKNNNSNEALKSDLSTDVKTYLQSAVNKINETANSGNYQKFEELGIIPQKDNPSSLLTVSERIEIQLATYCEDYVPTNSISISDIEEMYGNTSMSYEVAMTLKENNKPVTEENITKLQEKVEKLDSIGAVSRPMIKYMINNNLQVNTDNLYVAKHSTSVEKPEVTAPISDGEWEELKSSIVKNLESYGINVNDEVMKNTRWMVENNILVTPSNVLKVTDMVNLGDELSKNTNLLLEDFVQDRGYIETAIEVVNNGNEEQIEQLVLSNKEITILNMKKLSEENSKEYLEERKEIFEKEETYSKENTDKINAAIKQLEEARVLMSTGACSILIKNGMDIMVSKISDIVAKLKEADNNYANAVFENVREDQATPEDIRIFNESVWYMKDFKNTPNLVLGQVIKGETDFYINDITDSGKELANKLNTAQISYETLGTKPNSQLGDSIKKAFNNVESLLSELDILPTGANKEAVKILSYNEIDLSQENVTKIKMLSSEVDRLVENLTPRTTAYLISNGINPLKTDIFQLNDILQNINEELNIDEVEKYSEYLWKLEKNNNISKEDRSSYIGIYKALNLINKNSKKAVGAVAKQGSEFTMSNLLTMARSENSKNKEVAIDDEVGLTKQVILGENNLGVLLGNFSNYEDIKKRYETNIISQAYNEISPENIQEVIEMDGDLSNKSGDNSQNQGQNQGQNDNNLGSSQTDQEYLEITVEQLVDTMIKGSSSTYIKDKPVNILNNHSNLWDSMEEGTGNSSSIENEAVKEKLKEFTELNYISEESLQTILNDGTKINIENLMAAFNLNTYKGGFFSKSFNSLKKEESSKIKSKCSDIIDNIDNGDKLVNSIEDLRDTTRDISINSTDVNVDINQMRQMNKTLNYIVNAAKNDTYYIPVELEDETSLIKLTVKKGTDQVGKITIETSDFKAGGFYGEFNLNSNKLKGYILCDNKTLADAFSNNIDDFCKEIRERDINIGKINVILGKFDTKVNKEQGNIKQSLDKSAKEENSNDKTSTSILYGIAREFIKFSMDLNV